MEPQTPRFSPLHLLVSWLVAAVAVVVAAEILPGVSVGASATRSSPRR